MMNDPGILNNYGALLGTMNRKDEEVFWLEKVLVCNLVARVLFLSYLFSSRAIGNSIGPNHGTRIDESGRVLSRRGSIGQSSGLSASRGEGQSHQRHPNEGFRSGT